MNYFIPNYTNYLKGHELFKIILFYLLYFFRHRKHHDLHTVVTWNSQNKKNKPSRIFTSTINDVIFKFSLSCIENDVVCCRRICLTHFIILFLKYHVTNDVHNYAFDAEKKGEDRIK